MYAPSDGADVTLDNVAVRNLMLIPDASGENFNVVFTAVNKGESASQLRLTFVSEDGSSEASADFLLEPGSTKFGDPNGDEPITLVSIKGAQAGGGVTTFLEVAGGGEEERVIPVIDGSGELTEYADYVISASELRKLEAANDDRGSGTAQGSQAGADTSAAAAETEEAEGAE